MSTLSVARQKEIDAVITRSIPLRYPDYDLYQICETLGIRFFDADLDGLQREDVSGVISETEAGEVYVFLNQKMTPSRKTFTLAHELGHYFLGHVDKNHKFRVDKYYYDSSQEAHQESEANYFAASLLMPEREFKRMMDLFGEYNYEDLARYFGVSVSAVKNRVEWLEDKRNQTMLQSLRTRS
jgi:Zn-dependent peptidase ImmA (M78 family)